jgi:hypothetical protein
MAKNPEAALMSQPAERDHRHARYAAAAKVIGRAAAQRAPIMAPLSARMGEPDIPPTIGYAALPKIIQLAAKRRAIERKQPTVQPGLLPLRQQAERERRRLRTEVLVLVA